MPVASRRALVEIRTIQRTTSDLLPESAAPFQMECYPNLVSDTQVTFDNMP